MMVMFATQDQPFSETLKILVRSGEAWMSPEKYNLGISIQIGWWIMENPMNMDDSGVLPFM